MGRTTLVRRKFRGHAIFFCWRLGFYCVPAGWFVRMDSARPQKLLNTMGEERGEDEEGKFGEHRGPAGDFRPFGENEARQPAGVGKDERAPGGVPSKRFVSRGDGRHRAVGEADLGGAHREMGSIVFAADVEARYADDAGSGSDEARDEAGEIWRGCSGARAAGEAIHDISAGLYVEAASIFWGNERGGLDAVGMAAYGSSFSAIRELGRKRSKKGNEVKK